jgi:hypothetical protein
LSAALKKKQSFKKDKVPYCAKHTVIKVESIN